MLDGNHNILSYPCDSVNKTVPYFKEFKREDFNDDPIDMFDHVGK